jgi:hypothetical protein
MDGGGILVLLIFASVGMAVFAIIRNSRDREAVRNESGSPALPSGEPWRFSDPDEP